MHKNNIIGISSNCQAEHSTNWRTPKVHKRKKHKQPRIFEVWAGLPLAPLCRDIHELKKSLIKLPSSQKKILELFIYMRSQGLPNWMSEEYIGKKLGISRPHVSRCVRNLQDWGFIDIYHRGSPGSNLSNVYKVADVFMKSHVWQELMSIMPIFRSFFLFLCLVKPILKPYPHEFGWATPGWQPKNVTRLIIDDNKDISLSSNQSIKDTQTWLQNLVQRSEFNKVENDFRRNRHERARDMYKPKPPSFLEGFRNAKKGYSDNDDTRRALLLKQQADFVVSEQAARLAIIEAERGTEREKENWAKGNEILRKAGLL